MNAKKGRHPLVRCEYRLKKGSKSDRSNGRNTWEMIKINRSLLNSCYRIGQTRRAMLTHFLLLLFCFSTVAHNFSKESLKNGLTECASELICDQDEADTKMFLCTKHTEALGVLGYLYFNRRFRYCHIRAVFCFENIDSYVYPDWYKWLMEMHRHTKRHKWD